MTPDHWQRLKGVFQGALERAGDERADFLEVACAADPTLRAEVDALLASHEESGGLMDEPAWAAAAEVDEPPSRVGQRMGPYELQQEVGHGGMGTVYRAVRADDEYRKVVAVKVVKRGMDTAFVLRRFRQERQVLAGLEHPNIARLLDGGATADGLPYLVMEWVAGVPIDRYCREKQLALRPKLELFRKVCAPVHSAHQNLVVHRDIKPSNILVTADAEPKLLDFGIAKLLQPGGTGDTIEATASVLRLMTPEYASPEQVRGEPVNTATDVYSLGVLLYELLTGVSPQRPTGRSPDEVLRAVCLQEPLPPSATGDRALRGDLDTIVLKAMRKEPARRYGSVQELSEDVRRHLEGLPVTARRDTLSYRARKFVRRHRGAVTAATAVVAALLAGAGISLHQARTARRERAVAQERFDMVRKLANAVVFDFDQALQDVPGATSARKLIVARAIEYLNTLSHQQATDRDLLRELAAAYLRIGDIQGDPTVHNLGDMSGALSSYTQALGLYRRLAAVDQGPETRRGLAATHRALGTHAWANGETGPALSHYREMLRLYEELSRTDGGNSSYRREMAAAHYYLGQVALQSGDAARAGEDYRRAADIWEGLAAADAGDRRTRRSLAVAYMKLGDTAVVSGDRSGALAWHRRASGMFDEMAAQPAAPSDIPRLAALAALSVADDLVDGSPREAQTQAERALATFRPMAQADPSDTQARGDAGYALLLLGDAFLAQRRLRESAQAFAQAARAVEQVLAANPSDVDGRHYLGSARRRLGHLAFRRRDVAASLDFYRGALPLLEAPEIRNRAGAELARLYQGLGDAQATGAEGRAWHKKSVDQWRDVAARRPLTPSEQVWFQEARRKAGLSRPRRRKARCTRPLII